jgi:hypothetical protein
MPLARFSLTRNSHVYVLSGQRAGLYVTHVDVSAMGFPVEWVQFDPNQHVIRVYQDRESAYLPLRYLSQDRTTYWTVQTYRLPLWPLVLAAALVVGHAGLRQIRRARRIAAGRCAACGYDLCATPDRCPECGVAAGGTSA